MPEYKLNDEEAEILKAYEDGEFESVLTPERKAEIKAIAENSLRKDKRINIRISSRDLLAIQKRAVIEGIPYQTLVSSILHKYISGSLRDVTPNKAPQSYIAKSRD
ncbi:MAG: hypothetical protein ACPG4N_07085 [Gammaproteobacteria bacterium]